MSPWHRSAYSLNFTWVKRICWKKQKICEKQKFFSTVVCACGQVTQLLCLNACTYKTGRITPASLTHSTNIDWSSRKCQALRSVLWIMGEQNREKGSKSSHGAYTLAPGEEVIQTENTVGVWWMLALSLPPLEMEKHEKTNPIETTSFKSAPN